jgi:phage tail-like protein
MPSINFDKKFLFQVLAAALSPQPIGFSKCSAIEVEVAEVSYKQGGTLIPHKYPGMLTFTDVTLERGRVANDSSILAWLGRVIDITQLGAYPNAGILYVPAGTTDPAVFKVDVDVLQRDRDGALLKVTRLNAAWPKKYVEGEWDNEADEVVVETLVIAYDFFTRVA